MPQNWLRVGQRLDCVHGVGAGSSGGRNCSGHN